MGKNNRYTLLVEENKSIYDECFWTLSLTDKDIDKIYYIKEISEKCLEKFGSDGNKLIIELDVWNVFIPEDEYIRKDIRPISSRIEYVGNDEFVVRCDFVDTCDDPSYIITERFKL